MRMRFVAVIDYDTETGGCEAECISHHRSGSVDLVADSGGPTGALRALADAIDAAEDRWQGIPD